MKLTINTKKIKKLNPCEDRLENWKKHYGAKSFRILNFLELDKITAEDKIWVSVRVLPRELVEVFAIDCAFSSFAYVGIRATPAASHAMRACAGSTYTETVIGASHAATKAACDANAAEGDAFYGKKERENQVDALITLVKDYGFR